MDLDKINKVCAVLFPIYKTPSRIELVFLENAIHKTVDFEHILVCPKNLNIDESFGNLSLLKICRFEDNYFEGVQGYNCLMLSIEFYKSFIDYEYVLIHQADAYLFKSNLRNWCNKGYDYVGAPWYRSNKLNKGPLFFWIYTNLFQKLLAIPRKSGWLYNKVGNGGLSLRKISSALYVLQNCPTSLIDLYLKSISINYHEDVFWSIEAPRICVGFNIPIWREALNFSIELEPEKAMAQLNGELPFGCHAPLLINNEFWQKYIPELQ